MFHWVGVIITSQWNIQKIVVHHGDEAVLVCLQPGGKFWLNVIALEATCSEGHLNSISETRITLSPPIYGDDILEVLIVHTASNRHAFVMCTRDEHSFSVSQYCEYTGTKVNSITRTVTDRDLLLTQLCDSRYCLSYNQVMEIWDCNCTDVAVSVADYTGVWDELG
ncbi:hypothetical protein Pelo_19052 [Pelomyxa schiedti]|nr:hypothetical protein Pelo_19052 [Pelomyxa schiedti]